MLTSISNKDKKLRISFPPPRKKKKRNITRRINNSSPLPYVSLSNDSPFCLKKKRKNHSRKRLFKRIKTNDWEKNKHNTNERIKPLSPHSFSSSVSLVRIFEEKKDKKRKKEFLPQFRPSSSRNVAATGGRGSRSLPVQCLSKERGDRAYRLPVLEASASSLNVSKRARRRDIFTRTGRLRWIGGNGPAAVLRK